MLKKSQIDWNSIQTVGLFVFGMFCLHSKAYPQKRIVSVSGGSVAIERKQELPPAQKKVVVLPKTSVATQQVTVALNDGISEGNVNPQEFDFDGNGNIDPNNSTDHLFVIFEPADFTAYGVEFPMRITGVRFFNNDHQTVWPALLVYPVTGDRTYFEVDTDTPLLQANNVAGPAWGMAAVDFVSPYTVNQTTSLAILIRFPEGVQYTEVGAGGGPAVGLDFDGSDDPSFPPAGITARNGNSFVTIDGENVFRMTSSGDGLPINLIMNLIVEPLTGPDIDVNPVEKNYGSLRLGESSSQPFVVSNAGMVNLNVTSTTLMGGDAGHFSIDAGGGTFTVAPGGTRNVDVSFNPTSVNAKSAFLRIFSNDPDESPLDVPLDGYGYYVARDCYQLSQDPIAWWPGDGNPNDIIGGKHGTPRNVQPGSGYGDGKVDEAFNFDGVDDYIDIGDNLDVGTSDFTLEGWIKGDPTMQEWGRILDKGYATGYTVGRKDNTNKVGFEYLGSGSQWNDFSTTSDIIDNTWHHFAIVKSGNTVKIFADGVEENSETVSTNNQDNNLPLYIGYNPGEGTTGHWKGMIDEIAIYDRALDANEILTIYYADSYGKCKDPQTPTELSVSGRLVDYDRQDPITNVRMNLTGDLTDEKTTDNQGQYGFTELPSGASYTVTPHQSGMFFQPAVRQYDPLTGDQANQDFTGSLYGDVSGNDELKSFDASMVLRFVVGLIGWQDPPRDSVAADVSGDGTIKSFDTSLILRYIVGIITSFPVEGSSAGKSVSANGQTHIGTVVRIEGGPLVTGTRTTISVSIENEDDVFSSDLTFSFNPSVLKLVTISTGDIAEGFRAAHSVHNNEIQIGLAGAHPIQSSGRLLNLEFDVLPPTEALDDGSPLILEEGLFNEGLKPEKVINATFDSPTLPDRLTLWQNYPNPFNPITTISYAIPSQEGSQTVLLEIFNLNGEKINMLVNRRQPAGHYRVQWDGKTHLGELVPSGIYIYKLQAGVHIQVRKMMFLK